MHVSSNSHLRGYLYFCLHRLDQQWQEMVGDDRMIRVDPEQMLRIITWQCHQELEALSYLSFQTKVWDLCYFWPRSTYVTICAKVTVSDLSVNVDALSYVKLNEVWIHAGGSFEVPFPGGAGRAGDHKTRRSRCQWTEKSFKWQRRCSRDHEVTSLDTLLSDWFRLVLGSRWDVHDELIILRIFVQYMM